tara:strand:- start:122 stop:997 length:876 start_codon:yes stop_codon:yes gene_type:complete
MKTKPSTAKRVSRVVRDQPPHWVGDGFRVRGLLSYQDDPEGVSPFLLLDYAAPHEFAPSEHQRGVGTHPHRGFETVTIAYQGEVEHKDSTGAVGKIGAGDVQWMTAGGGILHEERHGRAFARAGGTFEMVQFWVNLPSQHKLAKPGYQALEAGVIPTLELAEGAGSARVIAGELAGVKGPAKTFTPINVWDLELRAGRSTTLELPAGHTGALLVRRGSLSVAGSELGPAELARLSLEGESLELEAREDSSALLLTGVPLGEPVVGYGPFVMNTEEEIRTAFRDLQSGSFAR